MFYELCRIIFWTIYSYQSYVAMDVGGCYSLGVRCLSAVYVTVYVGGNCMCVIQFCTAFNIIVTQVSCIFLSPCLKFMFVKQLFDSIFGPWQTLRVHVYVCVVCVPSKNWFVQIFLLSLRMQECSIFIFEKRCAEKLHKPKRKETVTEILRNSIKQLERFRHPKVIMIWAHDFHMKWFIRIWQF